MASHQRRISSPRPSSGLGAAGIGRCSLGAQITRFAIARSARRQARELDPTGYRWAEFMRKAYMHAQSGQGTEKGKVGKPKSA